MYRIKMKHYALFLALLLSCAGLCMPLSLRANTIQAQANRSLCKGQILDAKGQSVIGASIVVKGSKHGTVTDLQGKFSLPNVKIGAKLEISCIGYKTQIVTFTGKTLKIVLQEDKRLLNEVVVVGYGTQKKVNVTGAVGTIDTKTLANRPVQNISQVLQGQIPGLNIANTTDGGELGASQAVNIRGVGTIGDGSSSAPLVIVDGVPSSLDLVNPNDIASISVLKDAAASSIYGSRAAFGVILIKTRSGSAGTTKVRYTGNIRFSYPTRLPKIANNTDFAKYFNEASINVGANPIFSPKILDMMKQYNEGKFTDPTTPQYYGSSGVNKSNGFLNGNGAAFANSKWFDYYYTKFSPSYENNISISGGKSGITYDISANYLHQRGLLKIAKDTYQRYFLNAKISVPLGKNSRLSYYGKWRRANYDMPTYLKDKNGIFFHNLVRRWPTNPFKQTFGHYVRDVDAGALVFGGNTTTTRDDYSHQLVLNLKPTRSWMVNVDLNHSRFFVKEHRIHLPYYAYKFDGSTMPALDDVRKAGFSGLDNENISFGDHFTFNAVSQLSKQISSHYVKFLVGTSAELYDYGSLSGEGQNYISVAVPELAKTQDLFKTSNGAKQLALLGFFSRLNYNYKEKYLLELNIRTDASSRFLKDKRWGVFPSISTGWNIAKEPFMSFANSYMDSFKFRLSWGSLGNNDINNWYPFYPSIPTGTLNSTWLQNGLQVNTAGLPPLVTSKLTWETVTTTNFGIDYAFFNDRLSGSLDIFKRYTKNMVGPPPTLPAILGSKPARVNNADMLSQGWEFELNWKDHFGALNYNLRLNIADSYNIITKYPNPTGSLKDWYVGRRFGEIWGYKTIGIAQSDEEMAKHLAKVNQNALGTKWAAGDIMYADLNHDGKITTGASTLENHGDLMIIGNETPRYNFGFYINADYKGFDLSIFIQGVGKRDVAFSGRDPYFFGATDSKWQSTAFVEHLDYWTPKNRNAYYARPSFDKTNKNRQYQTRFTQSAAYARVKNVQLGYSLPKSVTKRLHLQMLRFFMSADNLYTITKLTPIYDPEAVTGKWGASGKIYPLQSVVAFGLNLTF